MRLRTVTAALAAVVLVGCTLLVAWHRATVTHGVCVEHGEEIHLERTSDAAPADQRDDAARLFAGSFAVEDGDEHCDLLATSTGVASPGSAVGLDAVAVAALDHALPVPAPHATVGLYRLAPKTSPPA